MTWVRFDDQFGDHPKIEELSDAAFRLHIRASCYSAKFGLGGVVPKGALAGLARGKRWQRLVAELRRCVIPKKGPLWDQRDDGHFQIHDFGEFNFSAEEEEERAAILREKRREAGRRGGKKSAETRRSSVGSAQPTSKPSDTELEASSEAKPEAIASANSKQNASKQTQANSKQNEPPIPIPFASSEAKRGDDRSKTKQTSPKQNEARWAMEHLFEQPMQRLDVREAWAHWKNVFGKPNAKLERSRAQVIAERIDAGATIEQIDLAYEGAKRDDWIPTKSFQISLILGDQDRFEHLVSLGNGDVKAPVKRRNNPGPVQRDHGQNPFFDPTKV